MHSPSSHWKYVSWHDSDDTAKTDLQEMSLTLPEDPEYCTGNVDSQSQGGNKNELRKTCHRTDLFNQNTMYCWGGLCDYGTYLEGGQADGMDSTMC